MKQLLGLDVFVTPIKKSHPREVSDLQISSVFVKVLGHFRLVDKSLYDRPPTANNVLHEDDLALFTPHHSPHTARATCTSSVLGETELYLLLVDPTQHGKVIM